MERFIYGFCIRANTACARMVLQPLKNRKRALRPNSSRRGLNQMIIGDRLRELREQKKLSQGDIEKKTGLLRCYVSRIENSHSVPAFETLEKFARALEVPMYELFYDGERPPELPTLPKSATEANAAWGSEGKDAHWLAKLRHLLGRVTDRDRQIVMSIVQKMAKEKSITGCSGANSLER